MAGRLARARARLRTRLTTMLASQGLTASSRIRAGSQRAQRPVGPDERVLGKILGLGRLAGQAQRDE